MPNNEIVDPTVDCRLLFIIPKNKSILGRGLRFEAEIYIFALCHRFFPCSAEIWNIMENRGFGSDKDINLRKTLQRIDSRKEKEFISDKFDDVRTLLIEEIALLVRQMEHSGTLSHILTLHNL